MELLYESYISIIGDVLKRSQPRRIGKNVRLSEAARGRRMDLDILCDV